MKDLSNEMRKASEVWSTDDHNDRSGDFGDDATSTDASTSAGTTRNEGKVEQTLRTELIQNEDQAVRRSKVLVALSVLICAVAVGCSVFFFAKSSDVNSFEIAFNGYAGDIISIVQWDIQNNFALMGQVSAATTGAAMMMNVSFPFVTQPTYEITGGYADGMGGIMACGFAPLVTSENRQEWEEYSVKHQDWMIESGFLKEWHPSHRDAVHGTFQDHEHDRRRRLSEAAEAMPDIPPISDKIYHWVDGERVPEPVQPNRNYLPLWQVSPADSSAVNVNLLSDTRMMELYENMLAMNTSVLSGFTQINDLWDWMFDDHEKIQKTDPHIFLMEPVFDTFEPHKKKLVGVLAGLSSWKNVFDRLLPDKTNGILCVVRDTCGVDFTYRLDGPRSIFLGIGDQHNPKFDYLDHYVQLELYEKVTDGVCLHHLHVYPSETFKDEFMTSKPAIYTAIVSLAFILTTAVFILYDVMVTRRQEKTMESAVRTNNIVASLFPENVRQRLLADATKQTKPVAKKEAFRADRKQENFKEDSDRPIADFVPIVTVMSADIVGFTPWSSAREPFQVFRLLEIVYGALDKIAKKRKVFKVDTVGECYVAVTGMPKPRQDHASAMARFARDCIFELNIQVKKLELVFGPDTSELGFRIGLHSGAVTAGVLRGGNARYQLFGDTMLTSNQMKLTSGLNRVHISKTTADFLIASGKEHWLKLRDDRVAAEGKGEIDSYWLKLVEAIPSTSKNHESTTDSSQSNDEDNITRTFRVAHPTKTANFTYDSHDPAERRTRLIKWNVGVLLERIKLVVAKREEVDKDNIEVPDTVLKQLNQFVVGIAAMYRDNPFHNFEHASHVTMSVTKVLSRVVCGDELQSAEYTKDISSDPLMQLATLFSALIHDADHQGIPNIQLIKEDPYMSMMYDYRSVAENNSIAVAFSFFRQTDFEDLRDFVCPTMEDFNTFRDYVTKVVLATDIMDKDLKNERNARWAKAFDKECENDENINNIKAHIVLEHIIQASDVCHTMQHWSIYQKWNERLFMENYKAYKDGRSDKNPAEFWYQGEIGFFDFYIIPLAKKLEECGVFGVSSDEFLNYAYSNRAEWELRGREVVEEYVEKYCHGDTLQ